MLWIMLVLQSYTVCKYCRERMILKRSKGELFLVLCKDFSPLNSSHSMKKSLKDNRQVEWSNSRLNARCWFLTSDELWLTVTGLENMWLWRTIAVREGRTMETWSTDSVIVCKCERKQEGEEDLYSVSVSWQRSLGLCVHGTWKALSTGVQSAT